MDGPSHHDWLQHRLAHRRRISPFAMAERRSDTRHGHGRAAYSKNGESRTVPLNSRAKAAFHALSQMRRGPFVFAKPNGTPYKNVEHVFRKACKAAGLTGTGVSLHTLRHTFASNLVMAGVDLVTVQQYGGWSDLSLVQRYAHLSPHHKAKAIEKIAESFHNAIYNVSMRGVRREVMMPDQRVQR